MFSRLVQATLLALGLTICNHSNAAPLTYGTYYDETVGANCGSTSVANCRLNFSQLPADKLLVVQKIHCSFASSAPMVQVVLHISATLGGSTLSRYVTLALPTPQVLIGNNYWMNLREDTHWLIGQGRFPSINAGMASSGTIPLMNCTLIGELVTRLHSHERGRPSWRPRLFRAWRHQPTRPCGQPRWPTWVGEWTISASTGGGGTGSFRSQPVPFETVSGPIGSCHDVANCACDGCGHRLHACAGCGGSATHCDRRGSHSRWRYRSLP